MLNVIVAVLDTLSLLGVVIAYVLWRRRSAKKDDMGWKYVKEPAIIDDDYIPKPSVTVPGPKGLTWELLLYGAAIDPLLNAKYDSRTAARVVAYNAIAHIYEVASALYRLFDGNGTSGSDYNGRAHCLWYIKRECESILENQKPFRADERMCFSCLERIEDSIASLRQCGWGTNPERYVILNSKNGRYVYDRRSTVSDANIATVFFGAYDTERVLSFLPQGYEEKRVKTNWNIKLSEYVPSLLSYWGSEDAKERTQLILRRERD